MHSRYAGFTAPSPAVEKRIKAILSTLTLKEKIQLLGGHTGDVSTYGNAKAGIPALRMSDGPVGVHWFTKASTTYPASIGLAASWDRDLSYRVGQAIGRDSRARGIHILLAPGVNIYRSALCGRNFEYLGEDPYLASEMVVPYIRGCQDMGVAATVKHYAVNYQEYDRHNISSDLDERTLHEIYLPAFKAAIHEGGCAAVMTAYNLVNGVHCSEHQYLNNDVLKGEWGFDGLIMSDWVSTYSAVGAANGGLDLEMPTAKWLNAEKLVPAVKKGDVSEATIDDKVRRLVRMMVCFGWIDHDQEDPSIPLDDPDTSRVALEAARGSMVLLKNDGVLPLKRSEIRKLAVVGCNAHPAVIGGGGSAYNNPHRSVSMLDGIKAFVGDRVEVTYAPGPRPAREYETFKSCELRTEHGEPGLAAEYFDNPGLEGDPTARTVDEHVNFGWGSRPSAEGITRQHWSVRWTGYIRPDTEGAYLFYASAGDGGYRVYLDNHLVLDTWDNEKSGTQTAEMHLPAGVPLTVRVEYRKTRHWAAMHFGYESKDRIQAEMDEAMSVVGEADMVVAAVGHNNRTEGEGHDRSFGLPTGVDGFVARAAEKNANTVVVLNAGGNVDMSAWIDKVRGVVHAWYPGQDGGQAAAEVLFGAVNPSGKLPATFEEKLEDRSSYDCYHDDDGDKRVELTDGIFTGYRHTDKAKAAPRFPFGFGLSYTTFSYGNLKLSSAKMRPSGTLKVSFDVKNTGKVAGAEVAQVYVRDVKSSLPRPVKELKGFVKVQLDPGQKKTVSVILDSSAVAMYDPKKHAWVVEPGEFQVLVGASSADIKLRNSFTVGGVAEMAVGKAAAKPAKKTVRKAVKKASKKRAQTTRKPAAKVKKTARKTTKKPAKKVKKAAKKTARKAVKKTVRKSAGKPAKNAARKSTGKKAPSRRRKQ